MDRTSEQTAKLCDEVQELTWALLDDHATDQQVQRLEQMLLGDEEAREVYVNCMRLHADLHFLFRDKTSEPGKPVLPIGDGTPPVGAPFSPSEQA